tara:strand:+ start:1010 stop:1807 length:798 start_codon:yes stop_codon:yes gene_type:complete
MKKSVFVLFAILLLVLPSVLAVDIDILSIGGHKAFVYLKEPGTDNVLDILNGVTDSEGKLLLSSGFFTDSVDMKVNIVDPNNGNYIIEFEDTGVDATGGIKLYLPSGSGQTATPYALGAVEDVAEEEVAEEEPEEVVEEEEVVEDVEDEVVDSEEVSAGITGNAVSGIKDILGSKTSYYILGAIVALFALVFVIQIGRKKLAGGPASYKAVKFQGRNDSKKIAHAERKLAEAKAELDEIKNRKKKLAEAKARFQKDKDELSKLEG